MTTPTKGADRMRRDFESYVAANDASIERRSTGDYAEDTTESAWHAWQAAKQTPMVYDPAPRKSILTDEALHAEVLAFDNHLNIGNMDDTVAEIFHAMEAKLPNFVLDEQKIIAAFLERTGQYVTNDATREAAIAEAVAATSAAHAQEPAGWQARQYYVGEDAGWSEWKQVSSTDLKFYWQREKSSPGRYQVRPIYAATPDPKQSA